MMRDRARRSARGNRLGLVLVGSVLLLAGLAALAVGQGLFGTEPAGQVLLGATVMDVLGQPWVPYAAVALAIIVGFLALRWLMVQGLNDTVGRLFLERERDGRVEVAENVARGALEHEVAEYPGVRKAKARLTESSQEPHLRLALTLEDDADVAGVWHRVRADALSHLRRALELDSVPTIIRMSMTTPAKNSSPRSLA